MLGVTQDSEQNLTQANVANSEAAPVVAETTHPVDTPTEQQFQLTSEEEVLYQKALRRADVSWHMPDDPDKRKIVDFIIGISHGYNINCPLILGRRIAITDVVGDQDPEFIYELKLLIACAEGFRELALKVSWLPHEYLDADLLMPESINWLEDDIAYIRAKSDCLAGFNIDPMEMYRKYKAKRHAFFKSVIQKSDEGKSWTEKEIDDELAKMYKDIRQDLGLLNIYYKNLYPEGTLIRDLHKKLCKYVPGYFYLRDFFKVADPKGFETYQRNRDDGYGGWGMEEARNLSRRGDFGG